MSDLSSSTRQGQHVLIEPEGNLIAVKIDGHTVVRFDRKNAVLVGAALCRAAGEAQTPWVVPRFEEFNR